MQERGYSHATRTLDPRHDAPGRIGTFHWTKPDLGLFDFEGSKKDNIVWDGVGTHAFVPFKDLNPACPPEARYKALGVGGGKHGLFAFRSADGIHWTLYSPEPVVTKGAFDSQNLALWDTVRGEYREYHRDFRNGRDIRTSTSKDFLHWTEPQFVDYLPWTPSAGEIPDLEAAKQPAGRPGQLYTNQVAPYYRAPHLFLGFPTRYLDRGWTESTKALPRWDYREVRGAKSRREGTAVTEGLFMASRDGRHFAVWGEAFLRPGLRTRDNWFYGDNYQALGIGEPAGAQLLDVRGRRHPSRDPRRLRPAASRLRAVRLPGGLWRRAPASRWLAARPRRLQARRQTRAPPLRPPRRGPLRIPVHGVGEVSHHGLARVRFQTPLR